jgi:hypothetical protein
VTFAAAGAFAGLAALAVLVVLHLRAHAGVVREVPSTLLWDELRLTDPRGPVGLRRPTLPLLLVLQALAVALLIVALAKPTVPSSVPRPNRVFVVDDSWWMGAPGRVAAADREVERLVASDRSAVAVRIVLAGGLPTVLYRGGRSGVAAALARVRAGAAPADLATALTVATGLAGGPHSSVVLVRAPEDPVPAVGSLGGALRTDTIAGPVGDQGIFDPGARCGIGATASCEVYATVRNTTDHAVDDRVRADAAGRAPLVVRVRVAPHSSAPLVLTSASAQQVSLRVEAADPLPADNEAWVTVPAAGGLPAPSVVTVVGEPSVALATARAFAAVPGVQLRLRTPATFRRSDADQSSLVVLDHFVPPKGLPPSPAVLLIDPPRVPGGRVGGRLADPAVSGTDATSELLTGVTLSSLSIDQDAARKVSPPRWLAPVLWSPDGVLLAAGDDGRQRLATMSFEPGQSNLAQLPALPILAANFVRWAGGWAPATASAGIPIAVDATRGIGSVTLSRDGVAVEHASARTAPVVLAGQEPGLYTVHETGPGVGRSAVIPVNTTTADPLGAAPDDLALPVAVGSRLTGRSDADWFLAGALAVLIAEWCYWMVLRRRGRR